MLDRLRYYRALYRLRKGSRELRRLGGKVEEPRKQGKPKAEIDQLHTEWFRAELKRMDSAAYLTTTSLEQTARKCLIPVPDFTEEEVHEAFAGRGAKWRYSERIDAFILKEDAERELRVAIGVHRKERLEVWRLWVTTIVTVLTGLIGGLIGLLSISSSTASKPSANSR